MADFPEHGRWPATAFMRGWKAQARAFAHGFSALGAVYIRFEGIPDFQCTQRDKKRIPDFECEYFGRRSDPVRIVSLDSGHQPKVRTHVIGNAGGDPWLADGLLLVIPDETTPLRNGEKYLAVVERAILDPPVSGETLPGVPDDIAASAAVATMFTVQDSAGDLRRFVKAADEVMGAQPEIHTPLQGVRRVRQLTVRQGTTPGGAAATEKIMTFTDGAEEITYLEARPGADERVFLFTSATDPFDVYQVDIRVPVFRDARTRPYQAPGWRVLFDAGRSDGALTLPPTGNGAFHLEAVRVLIHLPRDNDQFTVLTWGHGSGGDATEPIVRPHAESDLGPIRSTLARAGAVIVSFDMPHFGRRFALIDKGYSGDSAFVNVPNLVSFRDSPRQAVIERRVIHYFVRETLPELFPGHTFLPNALASFGHSTGAQVAALSAVAESDSGPVAYMLSGGGGFLSHYPLEANVLERPIPFPGFEIGPYMGADLLGMAFGVPEAQRARIDRYHPILIPFQLMVDPSDPLAVAAHNPHPITVLAGQQDRQVPVASGRWLAMASPHGRYIACYPSSEYDGHYCAFREQEALSAFTQLMAETRAAATQRTISMHETEQEAGVNR